MQRKYMGIYGGRNTRVDMDGPQIFASQVQWNDLDRLRKMRAGSYGVIAILSFLYDADGNVVSVSLIDNKENMR